MPSKTQSDLLSDDAIRQRAYFMWENDGRPDGRHDHYWQLALQESREAAASQPAPRARKAAKADAPVVEPVAKSRKAKKSDEKPKKAATKPRSAVAAKLK